LPKSVWPRLHHQSSGDMAPCWFGSAATALAICWPLLASHASAPTSECLDLLAGANKLPALSTQQHEQTSEKRPVGFAKLGPGLAASHRPRPSSRPTGSQVKQGRSGRSRGRDGSESCPTPRCLHPNDTRRSSTGTHQHHCSSGSEVNQGSGCQAVLQLACRSEEPCINHSRRRHTTTDQPQERHWIGSSIEIRRNSSQHDSCRPPSFAVLPRCAAKRGSGPDTADP